MSEPRLLNGTEEIKLTTKTEILLFSALKAALCTHGKAGSLKTTITEFAMPRFSFSDCVSYRSGTVQIMTDGNNGQDVVRLIRED